MTFGEFVASRSLEFGVHTMDIADAVGRAECMQSGAAAIVTGILDGLLGSSVPDSLQWDTTTSSSRAPAGARSRPTNVSNSACSPTGFRCSGREARAATVISGQR